MQTARVEIHDGYDVFEKSVSEKLASIDIKVPLFKTNAEHLYETYLGSFPEANRQHYNCNACRNFIERYGDLVTVDDDGRLHSAVWNLDVPELFKDFAKVAVKAVRRAKITGAFLSKDPIWGTPVSPKGWTHLHGENPTLYQGVVKSASERMAELKEEHHLLARTLTKLDMEQIDLTFQILRSEQFPGYEKGVGIAQWLADVYQSRKNQNLVWRYVALAPPGFAHVKNSMVGTLLDDVLAGKSFEECKRAWSAKMHPLRYQRPTAPVGDNQIALAEKFVEKHGLTNSLKRCFAQIEQIRGIIWQPYPLSEREKKEGGVFGHLKNQSKAKIELSNQDITWAKFNRDVLPGAVSMEVYLPDRGSYVGITTAEDYEAPPILQWDKDDDRYPVTHYFYHLGSRPSKWGVQEGWSPVQCIFNAPHGDTLGHFQKFLVFNVAAMHDKDNTGLALFPEVLKNEYREIRRVLEAHSNNTKVTGVGNANGLAFSADCPVKVRVNGSAVYTIDRWE